MDLGRRTIAGKFRIFGLRGNLHVSIDEASWWPKGRRVAESLIAARRATLSFEA